MTTSLAKKQLNNCKNQPKMSKQIKPTNQMTHNEVTGASKFFACYMFSIFACAMLIHVAARIDWNDFIHIPVPDSNNIYINNIHRVA